VIPTVVGQVPQAGTQLEPADSWGTFKARWGVGRMDYKVEPGLYAVGRPTADSPVLVTANYKMSFDGLRREMTGRHAWLLVLDTDGINVWCAAGKGTFGTAELTARIEASGLTRVVSHREIIVPQLGAPGVAAHAVKKQSGFTVKYGPILAADLPAFLDAGGEASPGMRRRRFPFRERLVLVPMEMVGALKWVLLAVPLLFLLGGLGGPQGYWADALHYGFFAGLAFVTGILAGTALMPVLLPVLPGRAFAIKGLMAGLIAAGPLLWWRASAWPPPWSIGELVGLLMILLAIASYYGMNFTGSSTYTSLSGVKKEMRWAVPLQIAGGAAGFIIWLLARVLG
jgi:hypothetical protein